MRSRKREPLFRILLDTGLQLVDSLRDRSPDNLDDIKGKVQDTYGTASDRVSRATTHFAAKKNPTYSAKPLR